MSLSGAAGRSAGAVMLTVIAVIAATAGGVLGMRHPWFSADSDVDTSVEGSADVIHNPPLLVNDHEPLQLDFRFVCAWTGETLGECEPGGSVHVVDASGVEHEYPLSAVDGSVIDLRAVVPPEVLAKGPIQYRAMIGVNDSEPSSWPDSSMNAMIAWPVQNLKAVRLSESSEPPDPGKPVVVGSWGPGLEEFGRSDEGFGPASFDVDGSGTLWVLDQENQRVATITAAGSREDVPLDVEQEVTDIAVADSGAMSLLLPNGDADSDRSVVEEHSSAGRVLERFETASDSAANIRLVGDRTIAWSSSEQQWIEISSSGRARSLAAQQQSSTPGRAGGDGRQIVVKHAGDHEIRVAVVSEGHVEQAWSITSRSLLGHVELANLTGNHAFVVLSEFDDKQGRFHILDLGEETLSDVVTPDERYGEMTATSIFRVGDGTVFQARSTPDQFGIYKYDLEGVRR